VDIQVIAFLTVVLLVLAVAFQVALAAGAPWGAVAYGGRAISDGGALPLAYRLGSCVAALVLLGAAWVVLASTSVIGRGPISSQALTVILWCLAVMFAVNTLGNTRGLHPLERWGAGTVTALLAIFFALVAAS
jgi:hypothetical protein